MTLALAFDGILLLLLVCTLSYGIYHWVIPAFARAHHLQKTHYQNLVDQRDLMIATHKRIAREFEQQQQCTAHVQHKLAQWYQLQQVETERKKSKQDAITAEIIHRRVVQATQYRAECIRALALPRAIRQATHELFPLSSSDRGTRLLHELVRDLSARLTKTLPPS